MASDASNTPITILHLEDDPSFARKTRQTLSVDDLPIEVDLVKTQKSFKDQLNNKFYDLIFLDDHVPDGNGLEALKIIGENQISSTVVMVSDLLDEGSIVKSIKLGAADYVLKSNLDGLLEIVRKVRNENKDCKSKINFKNFYDASPDLLCVLNSNGEFVNANGAWSNTLGISAVDLIGKSFVEFVHPNYRDNAQTQFNSLFQESRESSNLTSFFVAPNNDVRWLQWNTSEPANGVIYVTARDITDLKQQATDLLKEQIDLKNQIEEYKSEINKKTIVADQIHDSIITTDLKGVITNWNRGSEEIFGYKSNEAMGEHISMVYPEKEYKYIQEEGGDILLEQGSRDLEVQMCRKSGEIFHAKLSLSVTRGENGEVNGMVGYAVDLGPTQSTGEPVSPSDQPSQAEQELQQAMQQVNELELQLKDTEEMLNKAEHELKLMDQDLTQARQKIQDVEENSRQLEQKLLDSENQLTESKHRYADSSQDAVLVSDADKNHIQDISEAIQREKQLKSEFLASISHELRVTLNSILGFSQVIGLDETLSEQNKQYLVEISNAGTNLLNIVSQLIDVVKLESGKHKLDSVETNITQLVEQCINEVKQKSGENFKIDLSVVNSDDPVFAHTDGRRLRQIISYVIGNAAKYSLDGEKLDIVPKKAEGKVLISISSPGAKTSPQDRELDTASKDFSINEQKGLTSTKIELLIFQTLLELMGGNIHYEFDPDKVIVITIPGEETTKYESPTHQNSNGPQIQPQDNILIDTILYIEDDNANVRLVETLLAQRPNCKLVSVQMPEHLLETVRKHDPSLILLDMNIENVDSYALIDQLKQDDMSKATPVIALSTDTYRENVEKAKTAGFTDYLTKPLDINKFLNVVDSLLDSKNSLQIAQ